MTKLHFYPELSTYGAFEVMVLSISETATDGNNELPRNPRQFNYSWNYLRIPRLITGVVTISRALRRQRRAQRMSSSFWSRPRFWSGADPPPPQFCAKVVAASTCPTNRRKAIRKMLPDSSGEWVRSIALLSS